MDIQPLPANQGEQTKLCSGRVRIVFISLLACMALLFGRILDLQVLDRSKFLQRQGELRHVALVSMPAHRGRILDRHGDPLAISTPVESVWVNPQQFSQDPSHLKEVAQILGISNKRLQKKIQLNLDRHFVYIKRRIGPKQSDAINKLGLKGINFEEEFRRYYPAGEVTAHLLGFTDVDDEGQEGIELAYNDWLKGSAGSKRVIRDGKKRIIEELEQTKTPVEGQDLVLSIDQRLQYLAYRALKSAVRKHKARSASLLMLDPRNGEILAVVNQPSFNPNIRKQLSAYNYRNRAFVDVFEPGSTIKPFAISCALDAGLFHPNSMVDTTPGFLRVGRNIVRDHHNYGTLDITGVLQKSSNVGISKIALSLKSRQLWRCYNAIGLARPPGTFFPGEAIGSLPDSSQWNRFEQAAMSFGYGVSVSALQLAQAYAVLANNGVMHRPSLIRASGYESPVKAISEETARSVRKMLQSVVSRKGTAWSAQVSGYKVAGKTGTVKKFTIGGYSEDKYISIFAGIAPVVDPRLVMVVVIDEPSGRDYYGGIVAAPVFSEVIGIALRMLGLPSRDPREIPIILADQSDPA